ncbi:MAG TPA: PTPA-CTERM sorting domain-containing protein [Leptolyngbyaceae cyanobacterium]
MSTASNQDHSLSEEASSPPSAGTIGQILTVEENSILKSFSIDLRSTSTKTSSVTLVAYVMEWNGAGVQGEILYQSLPKTKAGISGVEQFDFNTESTKPVLQAGKQYVAFVTTVGLGEEASEITTGSPLSNVYSGGHFVSKSGDFQSGEWNSYGNGDAPFKVLLAAAPAEEEEADESPVGAVAGATALVAAGGIAADAIMSQGDQQQVNQHQPPSEENQPPPSEGNQPPPQAVPTPALLPGLIGLSVGALRKRKLDEKKTSQ